MSGLGFFLPFVRDGGVPVPVFTPMGIPHTIPKVLLRETGDPPMSPCRASFPNGIIKEGVRGRGPNTCPNRVWRLFSFPRRGETRHLSLLAGSMRWLLVGHQCFRTAITPLLSGCITSWKNVSMMLPLSNQMWDWSSSLILQMRMKHPLLYLTLDLKIVTLTFLIYFILFTLICLFVIVAEKMNTFIFFCYSRIQILIEHLKF